MSRRASTWPRESTATPLVNGRPPLHRHTNRHATKTRPLSTPWGKNYVLFGLNDNIVGAQKSKSVKSMPLNSLVFDMAAVEENLGSRRIPVPDLGVVPCGLSPPAAFTVAQRRTWQENRAESLFLLEGPGNPLTGVM